MGEFQNIFIPHPELIQLPTGGIRMAKISRQIRLEPRVEEAVQRVADLESRTFSSTCNWLLEKAAAGYLVSHESGNE